MKGSLYGCGVTMLKHYYPQLLSGDKIIQYSAVLNRQLRDYLFYFDKLSTAKRSSLKPQSKRGSYFLL